MRARFFLFFLSGVAALAVAATFKGAAAQEKILTEAYNASGQALFRQFSVEPGNIVFSPYSIGTAMSMALSGARTSTETEMLSVLKHRLSRVEIDAANGKLMAILAGYDQSTLPPACPRGMKLDGERCVATPSGDRCPVPSKKDGFICTSLSMPLPWAKVLTANVLMMPKITDEISFAYVDQLKSQYEAEVFRGVGLDEINDWVKKKTEGRIEKILERLNPNSPAVVLNAIYFKAAWASVFKTADTKAANFNLSRGRQVQVPTMRQYGRYATVSRTGYQAIRLPYAVKSVGMIVVLPNDMDGVGPVSARLDARELDEMLAALRKAPELAVNLALPRFKAMYWADLRQAFLQIGLSSPFSRDQADFSGMTGLPLSRARLMIGEIKHVAVIDAQEEGTEAGAATAIVMVPKSDPIRQETFLVDRPFLFYVIDDKTGAILFQGRISDPR